MSDEGGEPPANGNDDGGARGTVCPFCAVGCRLDREDGRVVGREGPANPDGRLCRQGLRAFDPVDDDERLTQPLVRKGGGDGADGADGDLVPASWDAALDRVVRGFERVREERGPDALAFLGAPQCTNEENYLLQKLARALGTNNVDNRARRCHAATARTAASRLGWPAATNSLDDLGEAAVYLVFGANPAARQPVAFDSVVRPAVADGATLVHVDPHQNETTRLADRHLAPRPGTDALLVALLCALVVAAGDVDRAFVDERTTGFPTFRHSLPDVSPPEDGASSDDAYEGIVGEHGDTADLAPDLAAGAATVDVPVADLRAVAREVGQADGVAVLTGTGVDRRPTADALLDLLLLTGNVGRPGTGLFPLRGLANEQGASDVGCVPDRLPGHRPVSGADARAALAEEWGYDVPRRPGLTEAALLDEFGDGIRAALVVGENPAVSKRDRDEVARGLDALDTLAVLELTESETTARADVVLPAAAGVEKAGTVTNLDRQIQRRRRLADPPGAARTDFAILRELGQRLVDEGFAPPTPRETFAELARVTPVYADADYDALAVRGRRWPTGEADPAVLYRESFLTADGRAPFVPVDTSAAGVAADDGDAADDGANGERVDGDADAPLRLVVGNRAGGFVGDDRVDQRLTIHPTDASRRDVVEGDAVVVETDAASVETVARVSEAVRPGTVYLPASVADPLVRGEEPTVRVRPEDGED